MISRPDLAAAPAPVPAPSLPRATAFGEDRVPAAPANPAAVSVPVSADVAAWFVAHGLDLEREVDAILRAHILARAGRAEP